MKWLRVKWNHYRLIQSLHNMSSILIAARKAASCLSKRLQFNSVCLLPPDRALTIASTQSASAVMRAGSLASLRFCYTRRMAERTGSASPSVPSFQVGGERATRIEIEVAVSRLGVLIQPYGSRARTLFAPSGTPIVISALNSKGGAEMTTDQGAIYVTDNAAYTWTAAVQETVDATLNRTVSSGKFTEQGGRTPVPERGESGPRPMDSVPHPPASFFPPFRQASAEPLTMRAPSLMSHATRLGSTLRSAPAGTSS